MSNQVTTPKPSLMVRLGLVGFGIVAAFALATCMLALFPNLLFPEEFQHDRFARDEAGTQIEAVFRLMDGDLFAYLPGRIRPPENNDVLTRFTLAWDENGFRVPYHEAEAYPIAVLGDSFAEGIQVPHPWPNKLAQEWDIPIYNYGYRGYGAAEAEQIVKEFFPQQTPEVVLYMHFSGNDMMDATRDAPVEARSPFLWVPYLAAEAADNASDEIERRTPDDDYAFPLPIIIGGNYYEMAFHPEYLWQQPAPQGGFANTAAMRQINQTLDTVETHTDPAKRCLVFIFAPSKPQLYYPYIYDTERRWVRESAWRLARDERDHLYLTPREIAPDEEPAFIESFDDQRDAIAATLAERPEWHFIDLLPIFKDAVAAGELLYFRFDTHWNEQGHDLALRTIETETAAACSSQLDSISMP